jgi:phage replication-related protein YjqB (UPF0714/DUF867 family)
MCSHAARVRRSLSTQQDLRRRPEHCSADAQALIALGIAAGYQVRIRRDDLTYGLYTVAEVRTENPPDIVRMGLGGRRRLDTDEEFDAELDSQIVHPTLSDTEARHAGEFVERLHDDGSDAALIAIAPHGGDIELHTDEQAQRVASRLADHAVSYWLCKGYQTRGAALAWHITSRDIHPESFPKLRSIFGRGFVHAVAFHGFDDAEILVGGMAPMELKTDIAAAIRRVVARSNISVRIACPTDLFGGDDPHNIVNRLTAGGDNGVQIEQSLSARQSHWADIADAVAAVYDSRAD